MPRERVRDVTAVDVDLARAPRDVLTRLADELRPRLDAAARDAREASRVFSRERALLDALRRKSRAQHRASKHHGALTRACARGRTYDAQEAVAKLEALARDVDACARDSRLAYGHDALVMPARARADEAMRAACAACAVLSELQGAGEDCVEAFAGQLGRGYFMALSATATACASRVRCESARVLRALVGAYNVVVDVREHLPPPGRYDAAFGRRPPAELRVATAADGGVRATPVGDDEVRADEELDVFWASAVSNAREGAEPSADVNVEADDELSELGVRVDRDDVAERDVIRVAKQSQVPQAKARKYERTVSVASPFGALTAAPAVLNPFAPKKRRRKKKGGGEEPPTAGKKKKPKRSDAPKTAADAFERLRQISSYGGGPD